MKRTFRRGLFGILAGGMLLVASGTSVMGAGQNYTDADGNGVCDYVESVCHFTDENQDGICDNCQRMHKDKCTSVSDRNRAHGCHGAGQKSGEGNRCRGERNR